MPTTQQPSSSLSQHRLDTTNSRQPGAHSSVASPPEITLARVLIVEYNPDRAFGLRTGLEIEGYEVSIANNGETGLERARGWNPDLIMLDLMLPGMDGYRVLRQLRDS